MLQAQVGTKFKHQQQFLHTFPQALPPQGQPLINIPLHPIPLMQQQPLVSRVSAAAKKDGGDKGGEERIEPQAGDDHPKEPQPRDNLEQPQSQQPVPLSPSSGNSGSSDAEESVGIR
eukprot:1084502-Pelagomonas_calceolata.AAC.1